MDATWIPHGIHMDSVIAILHCALLHPCDVMIRNLPMLNVAKYVDDLSLKVSGVAEQVVSTAKEVATWMSAHLKEELDIQVSVDIATGQGKTVALTTNMRLRRILKTPFAKLRIKFESRAKNLGLDQYGAGMVKDRGKTARSKRFFACVARTGRLR